MRADPVPVTQDRSRVPFEIPFPESLSLDKSEIGREIVAIEYLLRPLGCVVVHRVMYGVPVGPFPFIERSI